MSKSAICAADILDAWRKDDAEQLTITLANGAAADFDPNENSFECERCELLDGVAAQIERSITSGEDAGPYIRLLQHLAAPVVMQSKLNTNH